MSTEQSVHLQHAESIKIELKQPQQQQNPQRKNNCVQIYEYTNIY